MSPDWTIKANVLIIGGGAAAVRAALEASQAVDNVVLVLKGNDLGSGGSTFYPLSPGWGIQAVLELQANEDSLEKHYGDIMVAAQGMCSPTLARILVEEAPKRVLELESYGLGFDKRDGQYVRVRGCFSTHPRCFQVSRVRKIVSTMREAVKKANIKIIPGIMVIDILTYDGECVGALGITRNAEKVLFESKSIVLATGGMGNIFKINMNTPDITADGQAMAFRAGVKLANLEFFQIGLGIVYPLKNALFLDRILRYHPPVFNTKKERYLSRYLPQEVSEVECLDSRSTHYPFTSRFVSKYFDIALFEEILASRGTENSGVYIDLAKIPDKVRSESALARIWYQWLDKLGFIPERDLMEISLFAHAFNGGVCINERAETNLPGLFAAGEIATGPHGADRLGGNMQTACQVFGARAGKFAAERSKKRASIRIDKSQLKNLSDKIDRLIKNKDSTATLEILINRVQALMWENVLVDRDERGLNKAIQEVQQLEKIYSDLKVNISGRLWSALAFKNMTGMASLIATTAKMRRESRGSHHRRDYPNKDDSFNRTIFVQRNRGKTTYWFDKFK